jgi:hypothetical protein
VLAVTREWGFAEADVERMNVNGSGISLGHPVGATGKRILATPTREISGRDARYGLETMCIGAGRAWPRSSSGSDRATGGGGSRVLRTLPSSSGRSPPVRRARGSRVIAGAGLVMDGTPGDRGGRPPAPTTGRFGTYGAHGSPLSGCD